MDIKYKKIISNYISNYYSKNNDKIFIIATHEPDLFINTVSNVKILLIDDGKIIDFFNYEENKYNTYLKKYF